MSLLTELVPLEEEIIKEKEEIFQLVAKHLGNPGAQPAAVVEPGADDVAAMVLDPSKTERTFGWRAVVNFEQTITRMLAWYDQHGVTDI